jgi:hypothetical protein
VTPKDLPEWIQINQIKASPFEPGAAYFAAVNYKNDDLKPYMYKTSDYGKTWKKIVSGIPADHFTRVVIEDPSKRGFLYAGTERGIFYSANDGDTWQSLQLNLPIVQIADLAVHKRDKDLVVATHGRSFYVLDNLAVVHQLAEGQRADAYLFPTEDAYRTAGGGGGQFNPLATVGRNPPTGAVVNYYFKDKPAGDVTIEFLDSTGKSIRRFIRRAERQGATGPEASAGGGGFGGGGGEPQPTADAGLNTFVWNYRLPNATTLPGLIMWGGSLAGPRVAPGNYRVRLSVGGKEVGTQPLVIRADPRLSTTQEEFNKQYELMAKINAKLNETHGAILDIRDMRTQMENISRRLKAPEQKDLIDKARDIGAKLTAIEEALHQTKIRSGQDALNFPIRLNNKLAGLSSYVDSSDEGPTAQSYVVYDDLTAKIDAQLKALAAIKSQDIADFNKQFAAKGLPVIIPR